MSVNGEHSLNDENSSIDAVIAYVKEEFKNILAKRKDLIIKLGEAFERKVSDSESVCEEIKNALREEIAQGLVSTRIIELHCLDKWKRKTKPKKVEKNENFSFSRQEEAIPQLLVDTHGNTVVESASDSNNSSPDNTEGCANEPVKYTENFHADNELEDVIRKSNSQSKIRELGTEIGILRQDLESKSKENAALQTQVKDLELKLKSALDNGFNQNSEDRFFKVQFQVPSEDLRRHMDSSRGKIDSVPITAEVDLVTKSITGIEIGEPDSQKSTRTGENSSFC